MIKSELADRKVFSLNDLIAMGLITKEDVEKWIRYQEAKATVNDLFKGMF
jgi:glutamate 5-kinase